MGIIGLLIIVATVYFSYRGFSSDMFYDRYKFEVEKIMVYKDYKRFISAGFLHVNWMHLLFNMISLYFFSGLIESTLGGLRFLVIYFTSMIGGFLLSLWVNRHHSDFSSVGASGAISGVLFASIALFPGFRHGALIYSHRDSRLDLRTSFCAVSIYGIRSKKDNIGHEAHLGGALIGMFVALAMRPSALLENYWAILVILLPTLAFIYLIITRPHILLVDNFYFKSHHSNLTIDQQYNLDKHRKQGKVDRILEKISKKGMKSLSREEEATSKRIRESMR